MILFIPSEMEFSRKLQFLVFYLHIIFEVFDTQFPIKGDTFYNKSGVITSYESL